MMEDKYTIYQPFHAAVGGGGETQIERVDVNSPDLHLLTKQLQMMSTQRTLAFFGQRKPVLEAVNEIIEENIKEDRLTKHNCIYVAIKDNWVAIFAIIDPKFFEKREIDKESIVITLFRYLQDFSSTIVFCIDEDTVEKFSASKKNPFTYVAHEPRIYMLETQTHAELKASKLETQCGQLERDLDFKLEMLVLNDNNSRFFLHQKQEELLENELSLKKIRCKSLIDTLLLQSELNFAQVETLVRESKVELSANLLCNVTSAYKQYINDLKKHRKLLAANLFKDIYYEIWKEFRGDTSIKNFLVQVKDTIINGSGPQDVSERLRIAADHLAIVTISGLLKQRTQDPAKNDYWDLHTLCASKITQFFTNLPQQLEPVKINESICRIFTLDRFYKLLDPTQVERMMQVMTNAINKIITSSNQSMKRLCLQLNICAINKQQNADGTCNGLIIAPYLSQITIQPEQQLEYFRISKQEQQSLNADFSSCQVKVKATFPLKGGLSFLLLFEKDGKSQVLVALSSSTGSWSIVTRWKMSCSYILLPYNSPTFDGQLMRFVLITDDKPRTCLVFYINESLKYEQRSSVLIDGRITGKIVSAAGFPSKEIVLLLADDGSLYELAIREGTEPQVSAKTLTIKVSESKKAAAKPSISTSWPVYLEVKSIENDNFFILRDNAKIDVFNWNFERQYTLDLPAGSNVKVFSDNKNVYLVAFDKNKITSQMFSELAADITLRHQKEATVEVENGNPIIDVIYATILKYGQNATFIGSPPQNQYIVALKSNDQIFSQKLHSYLKTFQKEMIVTTGTLQSICRQSQPKQANRHLPAIFSTRAPVHICTVEANNLLPLVDGNRMRVAADRATSIAEAAECMSFAHLERVVTEFCGDRTVRVVSIIGRQSSGKSYLLNQLFGTRFSVAATRCTDGIWMSYAQIMANDENDYSESTDSQSFLVLDCEGLFSINRSEQEEVKMLMVLAAISDVTILNQDLNFNRYINKLFTNLNNAIGKVSGSGYFHGVLMVAVRDICSTESQATTREFERNIKAISGRKEQFLIKLFKSTMIFQCLNHFQSSFFIDEIKGIRQKLVSDKFRSSNSPLTNKEGLGVMESLKVVLLQVYSDDEQLADEHLKQIAQNNIDNSVTAAWGFISNVGSKSEVTFRVKLSTGKPVSAVTEESLEQTIEVAQISVQFDHVASEDNSSFEKIKTALEEKFFQNSFSRRHSKQGYNQRWTAFDTFLQEFIRRRATLLEQYAQEQVQMLGSFMNDEEKRNIMIGLKEKILSLTINCGICLEQCAHCYLKCLNRKGHKESLEPKKQIVEKKLSSILSRRPVEKGLKIETLKKEINETNSKLQDKKQKLSVVEAALKDVDERYQEAKLFDDVTQTLTKSELEISEKQKTFENLSSRMKEVVSPTDSLPYSITEFASQVQLVKNELTCLRNEIRQSKDAMQVQETNQLNPPNTVDVQVNGRTQESVIDEDSSIAALEIGLKKLLDLILNDSSVDSNADELAMDKLSELCTKLPALCQLARQMVTRAQERLQKLDEQQRLIDELIRENKTLFDELMKQIVEYDGLKIRHNEFAVNFTKQKHELAVIEAELAAVQLKLVNKQTELRPVLAKLSEWNNTYRSFSDLEQQYVQVTARIDNLNATLKADEYTHGLLLSSEEESQQVAEMMVEYITQYNNEDHPTDATSPKCHDSLEEKVLQEDEDDCQKEIHSSLIENDLWSVPGVYVQYSKKLAACQKLKAQKQKCLKSIDELKKQILSLDGPLSTISDENFRGILQEQQKNYQNQKSQLEDHMSTLEKEELNLIDSVFFQRCQRQQQLFDILNGNYAVHIRNEKLLNRVLKVTQLQSDLSVLRLKLNPEGNEEANAVGDQTVRGEGSATNFVTVNTQIKQYEAKLRRSFEKVSEMLWNDAIHDKLQSTRKELPQLTEMKESIKSLLPEWRLMIHVYEEIQNDLQNLENLKGQKQLSLQEATRSINALESQQSNLQENMRQIQEKVTSVKAKSQEKQTIIDASNLKLQQEKEIAQLLNEHARRLDNKLTHLTNETVSRKQFEDLSRLKEQLKLELSSLAKTRNFAQEKRTKLAKKKLEPTEILLIKVNELSKSYEVLQKDVNAELATLAENSECMQLLANQEKLEKDISCECYSTNHECDQHCSICPDEAQQKCKHKAGHDDPELLQRGLAGPKEHCCNKPKHNCKGLCHLCDNPCVYPHGHENPNPHLCASNHQCKSRCQYCTNKCKGNLAVKHTIHVCTEDKCPKRCILCGNPCRGKHDHDETTSLVDVSNCFGVDLPTSLKDVAVTDPSDGKKKVKLHLCEKEHQCPRVCDKKGVCEIHYVSETREWTQYGSSQEYEYIKPERKSRRCALRIPPGKAWHEKDHDCGKLHTCTDICIECGSFCKENIGHVGLHKTALHRNMEHCYCVTKTRDEKVTVTDKSGGKKARVYLAGNALTPEICTQHCNRRGRAHYHLRPCPGGLNCGQIQHKMGVQHCNESFFPNPVKVYDKYLCAAFWSSLNWQPPSDDRANQLCNFFCPNKDHGSEPENRKFCTSSAWHTQSELAADHTFECGHDFTKPMFNGLDMCFCIDSTNSMLQYVKESAEAIKKIMKDVVPQLKAYGKDTSCLRFAVVGYWDHGQPEVEKHVDFCSDSRAIEFLDSLKAAHGGDFSEAVLDGLNAASCLSWRADCEKLLIHICDAPPHGRQFSSRGDNYPDGCPCKLNEVDVLMKLKSKDIKYYVIPLTSHLNLMINIFEKHIPVIRKELKDSVNLKTILPAIVCQAITDSELSATNEIAI